MSFGYSLFVLVLIELCRIEMNLGSPVSMPPLVLIELCRIEISKNKKWIAVREVLIELCRIEMKRYPDCLVLSYQF